MLDIFFLFGLWFLKQKSHTTHNHILCKVDKMWCKYLPLILVIFYLAIAVFMSDSCLRDLCKNHTKSYTYIYMYSKMLAGSFKGPFDSNLYMPSDVIVFFPILRAWPLRHVEVVSMKIWLRTLGLKELRPRGSEADVFFRAIDMEYMFKFSSCAGKITGRDLVGFLLDVNISMFYPEWCSLCYLLKQFVFKCSIFGPTK